MECCLNLHLLYYKKDDSIKLYKTGVYDAMYLAALSINPKSMSKEELDR